jgi:outer membrane biosynthesis protein TonB
MLPEPSRLGQSATRRARAGRLIHSIVPLVALLAFASAPALASPSPDPTPTSPSPDAAPVHKPDDAPSKSKPKPVHHTPAPVVHHTPAPVVQTPPPTTVQTPAPVVTPPPAPVVHHHARHHRRHHVVHHRKHKHAPAKPKAAPAPDAGNQLEVAAAPTAVRRVAAVLPVHVSSAGHSDSTLLAGAALGLLLLAVASTSLLRLALHAGGAGSRRSF